MTEKKEIYQEMRRPLQNLEESEIVIVPTEKANRFRSTRKCRYETMAEEHTKQQER